MRCMKLRLCETLNPVWCKEVSTSQTTEMAIDDNISLTIAISLTECRDLVTELMWLDTDRGIAVALNRCSRRCRDDRAGLRA